MLAVLRAEEPYDTGRMRDQSGILRPVRVAGGFVVTFYTRVKYGVYVHEGHGWIFPKKAKALRWVNKAGVVVFARRVRPVKARPFFYSTFRRLGFRKVQRHPR